ncbi:MAG: ABC transporter permease [Acidimicrobiia bacterium]
MTDAVDPAGGLFAAPPGRPATTEAAPAVRRPQGASRVLRRFLSRPSSVVALVVLVLVGGAALLAPVIAPHDPLQQDLRNVLAPSSGEHLLGTDELGRDVLSRLLHAGRTSLMAAVQAVVTSVVLGVPTGLVAGYTAGRIDRLLVRVADTIMCFPPLILAVAITGVLGPSLRNAMLAVGIGSAPRFFRLVRSVTLGLREETFVEASQSIGTPPLTIIRRHILPNLLSPVIVQISLAAGLAMLAEATLSFLGLGVQPPTASWGSMLTRASLYLGRSVGLVVYPGLMIMITVLALNVAGDGLRDALGHERRRSS